MTASQKWRRVTGQWLGSQAVRNCCGKERVQNPHTCQLFVSRLRSRSLLFAANPSTSMEEDGVAVAMAPRAKPWAVALIFFFPALGGFIFGYDIGATSFVIVQLADENLRLAQLGVCGLDLWRLFPFWYHQGRTRVSPFGLIRSFSFAPPASPNYPPLLLFFISVGSIGLL